MEKFFVRFYSHSDTRLHRPLNIHFKKIDINIRKRKLFFYVTINVQIFQINKKIILQVLERTSCFIVPYAKLNYQLPMLLDLERCIVSITEKLN